MNAKLVFVKNHAEEYVRNERQLCIGDCRRRRCRNIKENPRGYVRSLYAQ